MISQKYLSFNKKSAVVTRGRKLHKLICRYVWKQYFHYAIIVFTRKDDLDREKRQSENIKKKQEKTSRFLLKIAIIVILLLIIFYRSPSGEKQIEDLLKMIKDVVSQNNGRFYTNKLYALLEQGNINY